MIVSALKKAQFKFTIPFYMNFDNYVNHKQHDHYYIEKNNNTYCTVDLHVLHNNIRTI